jgi:hypothetical protein
MTKRIALAVVFSICGVAHAGAQQAATDAGTMLRWKFSAGQQFDVVIQQDTTQKMSLPAQEMNVSNEMTTTIKWVIKSVDADGAANIVQTINRVQMSIDSPQGKINYDSNDEEHEAKATQMATMFSPMIGVEIEQMMNDRGEILDVVFPDEALAGAKSNPLAAQMMTPEAIKEMTAKASPILPAGPAAVGQVWSKTGTSTTPIGDVSLKSTYTYEGKSPTNPALDLIRISMEMDFQPAESAFSPQIDVKEQDNAGTLMFDVANGYLTASELVQDMTMQIQAAGQNIDQNIKSTTKMTVTPRS